VRGTKVVWATVGAIIAAQFAVTYMPSLQRIIGTTSIPFVDGLLIVGVGVIFFIIIEIEKQLRLNFVRSKGAHSKFDNDLEGSR
jgi:hypothetical protein